jgi:hypothetical protein
MSTGVYFDQNQQNTMTIATTQANNAITVGNYYDVKSVLENYYDTQIYNSTEQETRGYAILAQATAGDSGIGLVPNQKVQNAVGSAASSFQSA